MNAPFMLVHDTNHTIQFPVHIYCKLGCWLRICSMEIKRAHHSNLICNTLHIFPICALGPRQYGKTTLALSMQKQFAHSHRFDLEDLHDPAKLDTPKLALGHLKGLVIIDEIQRRPELFPYLRVLVDSII